jgi:hypothetical protein
MITLFIGDGQYRQCSIMKRFIIVTKTTAKALLLLPEARKNVYINCLLGRLIIMILSIEIFQLFSNLHIYKQFKY